MKSLCPFCSQPSEVTDEIFDRPVICSNCKKTFRVAIVATPLIGPVYLDIETTAAPDKSYAEISSIVWWCDGEWHSWVNGRDKADKFIMYWSSASEIITFNGKAFDEPKICNYFTLGRHPNHSDMFHESRHRGIAGGLKEISSSMGFPRPQDLEKVDGSAAVRLWRRYEFDRDQAVTVQMELEKRWT